MRERKKKNDCLLLWNEMVPGPIDGADALSVALKHLSGRLIMGASPNRPGGRSPPDQFFWQNEAAPLGDFGCWTFEPSRPNYKTV